MGVEVVDPTHIKVTYISASKELSARINLFLYLFEIESETILIYVF